MLEYRKATLEDAEILYRWRHDPTTLQYSRNPEKVSFSNHLEWLKKSLQNPNRTILIFLHEDLLIGTGRADFDGRFYELSWTIAPDQRGLGYSHMLIKKLTEKFHPSRAEIKTDNIPSIKVAEKVGLRKVDKKDGMIFFEMTR